MAINPNISLAVKGIELQSPLEQYGKVMAIQGAQSQNQLAQLQMQQAMREQESTNALNQAYAQAYNPQTGEVDVNKLRTSLASGGYGSKLPGIEKQLLEAQTAKLAQQKGQTELIDAKLKQSRQFLDTINPADPNAPAQFIAWHEANHADPILGPALAARGVTADQSRARIQQAIQAGPEAFAQLLNQSKLGTEKFMEMNKPSVTSQNIGGTVRLLSTPGLGGAATVVPGSEATVTMTDYQKQQLENDQKRIKQDASRINLETRRVNVLEENARRDADPAFQQKMAVARATGEALAKGDVAAQQALPQIINRAEQSVQLIDELVGKRDAKGNLIEGTKPHPGFKGTVGFTWLPGQRFIPGTDEASFMSRFDQIKGTSFLEAFESLKGGGAITEKEGQKATDAINRMSISTSEDEFIRAAMDLQDVIRNGVKKAQAKAARGGTAPTGVPAAPAAGGVKFLGFE